MGRLKGSLAYCCGPMDDVADRGIHWRADIQEFLWQLGCGVLNPCDKPTKDASEDTSVFANINDLKQMGQYDAVSNIMKPIVNIDLNMVDMAQFLVMYVDTSCHMCGSYGEQAMACMQRKPVVVCCRQGKAKVPNWLFGICNHNLFFSDWNSVYKYLNYVDHGSTINKDDGWRFFDYKKIYNIDENNLDS